MEKNKISTVENESANQLTTAQNQAEKTMAKKKKKHVSALVAASMARSAVAHVNPHSDNNFNMGTNLTYNEENGI